MAQQKLIVPHYAEDTATAGISSLYQGEWQYMVGGGVAGLEAALWLGRRGYEVVLTEATRELGGRAARESRLPGLGEWRRTVDHRVGQLAHLDHVLVTLESPMTADEIAPNQELKLETRLNGEVLQSSHTGHMIFSIAKLINYASTIFTLSPGDVIATGTPPGVGMAKTPPRFLREDDVVTLGIDGLGQQRHRVIAWDHGRAHPTPQESA